MAKIGRPNIADPEGFTMTPMIDVVFQLLIFFMLITDMSRQQLAQLFLPTASKAVEENGAPDTLIVNVLDNGHFQIGGAEYAKEGIASILRARKTEHPDRGDKTFAAYPLMIRADGAVAYEHAQWLLMAAMKYGGVTKLQICAKKDNM